MDDEQAAFSGNHRDIGFRKSRQDEAIHLLRIPYQMTDRQSLFKATHQSMFAHYHFATLGTV